MRRILILLFMIMILTNTLVHSEIGIEENLRSYILADFETGQVLDEYNIDEVVEIASISKLMSYLVIMDEIGKKNLSLDDTITIDKDITRIKGSSFKLRIGEKFTLRELIEASIVVSGNDATYALAKHIAKTEEQFVTLMNKKAKEIGLLNAKFYNSTGLPVEGKDVQNIMTTREIFKLSQYIIKEYPSILEISKIKAIELVNRDFFQINTNPLLIKIKEVDGLKTGFTNKAGYCYVSTLNISGKENDTKDLRLIGVVMGAKNIEIRDDMAKILIEHGLKNYSNKILLDNNIPLNTLELRKGTITEVNTYPRDSFTKIIKNNDNVQLDISMDEIELPIKKDKKIGKATVRKDKEIIFETDIIAKENVHRAKWYILIGRSFSNIFKQWGRFFLFDLRQEDASCVAK